VENVQCLAI